MSDQTGEIFYTYFLSQISSMSVFDFGGLDVVFRYLSLFLLYINIKNR